MLESALLTAWLVICYLLGTLSLGDILGRLKGIDIRSVGTMNPGATNIYKTLGPIYGLAIFFLDVSKGLSSNFPKRTITDSEILIYPNPTKDIINLIYQQDAEIKLYGPLGKLIVYD